MQSAATPRPMATLVFDPLDEAAFARAQAVCLGTGRFLRAGLVPALQELGCSVVLAQARGDSFGRYMASPPAAECGYEVDTVLADGAVITTRHKIAACGSLGLAEGRRAFFALPGKLRRLRYVGVGLTEAGIVHNGPSICDLAEFLHACFVTGRADAHPLSVINTDNVPFNGDALRSHVSSCDIAQASLPS